MIFWMFRVGTSNPLRHVAHHLALQSRVVSNDQLEAELEPQNPARDPILRVETAVLLANEAHLASGTGMVTMGRLWQAFPSCKRL